MSDLITSERLIPDRLRTRSSLLAIFRHQLSKPFLAGVAALAGGAALANLVSIAATPICTRIYTPRDFGIFAQFAALTGILIPASSLGFEIAIPLENNEERANSIARLCLLLVALMAASSAALFIFGPGFAPRWIDSGMVRYWWIALITVASSGYYQMATYLAIRNRSYLALGKTTFQQAIGAAATQVFGGLLIRGPSSLLLSVAVATGWGGHRLVHACGSSASLWWAKWRWRDLASAVRKYWRIASGSLSSNTLNMFATQLPVLMISAAYGLNVCGLFLLASRIVSVTDRVITVSVARTYYGEAALRFAEDRQSLRPLFVKAVVSLTLVGLAGAAAIWILAPSVTRLVFGSSWAEAGIYARCLAPRFVGTMICSPVSDTAFILGRGMSKSVLECVRVGSTAALLWFCQATHQPPSNAVLGYSVLHLAIGLSWTGMLMMWINGAQRSAEPLAV